MVVVVGPRLTLGTPWCTRSKQRVNAMKEDLSFRKRVMESAQTTHQRLLQELAKRNSELEKIDTLDAKIALELKSLNDKIEHMNNTMPEYTDIDALRAKAEEAKRQLTRTKATYMRRRDLIRQQVRQLSARCVCLRGWMAWGCMGSVAHVCRFPA